ncbi:hypothetical protein MKW98_030205 [Papaver atlanticum]|uniref:Uncharacterized protein n=1 Tax=Papaver atlanticum TaxID=357466 RepID=A0AAD4XK50_9MAGN|nr:hypothetical protein MKW98_030205 [Papaver atlanticum]
MVDGLIRLMEGKKTGPINIRHPDNCAGVSLGSEMSGGVSNVTGANGTQNRFIHSSECLSVCAAHPLNGTIIAGTKELISALCTKAGMYAIRARRITVTEKDFLGVGFLFGFVSTLHYFS